MKYLGYAILALLLWLIVSFTHDTLWPSGPGAWTDGVDTSTWWTDTQAPVKKPPTKKGKVQA